VPIILSKVPFYTQDDDARFVTFGGSRVQIKPYQIVVWIGISASDADLDEAAPRIPALLDTGHAHYFAIQASHLFKWAGLHPDSLIPLPDIRINHIQVPVRKATIWLQPGWPLPHHALKLPKPFRLAAGDRIGIAVYPRGGQDPNNKDYPADFPRLPSLGMLGLTRQQLRLSIDFRKRHASLYRPYRIPQ